MVETYDYIIVGGGSAGCVLANRLSADRQNRVLLLEAGPRDWNPLYRVPVMAGRFYRMKYNNWWFLTEPEKQLKNRQIVWPRGKVLGGSSAINGMIYARGNKLDYDTWAQMGLPSWSYERVLPDFKRSENYFGGADEFHGGDGPLPVTRMNSGHPFFDLLIEAGQQEGYKYNPDFNGAEQEGVGHYDYNIKGGERWSAARSYLGPIKDRTNLTIMTSAHLQRVLIEHGRAVGVLVKRGAEERKIYAEREVVISSGAVNSPMILMHSGIGDADDLRAVGVTPVHDLKGVGRNLQDHLNFCLFYTTAERDLFYDFTRIDRAIVGMLRAILFRTGTATLFPHEGAAFLRTDPSAASPDVQVHFLASGLRSMQLRMPFAKKPADGQVYGYAANICQLRPESRGELKLRSNDPAAAPIIRANYLSTETDKRVMREAFRLIERILNQPAFDKVRGRRIFPTAELKTDAEIDDWIASVASTVFHPAGTCKMGIDSMAVVDERLRVHGLDGLRVVDASVMPNLISANTHAPTVMIAERASDCILEDNGAGLRAAA